MENCDIPVPHVRPPEGNPAASGGRLGPTVPPFLAPAGRIDSAPTLSSSPRPWLTLPEVADLLALSRAAAYRLADEPSFPSTRIGGAIRVERQALARWLAARTQRSRKAAC